MDRHFLSLSPTERLAQMSHLIRDFKAKASELQAPFTILVYGSTSYGLNPKQYGQLDDIDLFLIIPRSLSPSDLLGIARNVFRTSFDISIEHLRQLQRGSWEICRMYGSTEGLKIGFRIMCQDTFESLATFKGSTSSMRNVATVGASRIIVDVEWSISSWRYVPVELSHSLIKQDEDDLLLVNHHLFSPNRRQLGALGRKLLTCKVIYDSSGHANSTLLHIWKMYVELCTEHYPKIRTKDIINSVLRSEKFSINFRRRLSRIIRKARSSISS